MFHKVSFDITQFPGDAIVNSLGAGEYIEQPGRIYRSILHACNDPMALMKEVTEQGKNLAFGQVYLTDSFGLPSKKIIHVITPFRRFDRDNSQITKCYEDLLQLALSSGLKSVCVPLIGTGANGYHSDKVASIARRACYKFAEEHPEIDVYFNLYTVEFGAFEEDELYREEIHRDKLRYPRSEGNYPRDRRQECGISFVVEPSSTHRPHPEKPFKPAIPFLEEIGVAYGDSFAALVRKCVFTRFKGKKADKEAALEDVWLEINSLVGDFKTDFKTLSETIKSIHETKEAGLPTDKDLLKEKTSHAPQYEWKKVKNPKGKGYVWQRPNKVEILLAAVGLHLKPHEVMEVYEFCGFSLSKYEMYDYAIRECVPLINKRDPWTQIVQRYRNYTSESLYEYKEERKKIYTDHGEDW